MSHIEKKRIKGRIYLYRYECYRDDSGRVKKRMLQYLGPLTDFQGIADGVVPVREVKPKAAKQAAEVNDGKE